ncbi:putative AP-4 complex accessory subunit Tepsin [Helianthus debilis subsp. tardiflorus]
MQRNSVAVRQPDPLKGNALNKSVRETAQEALTAIFAGEDNNKPPQTKGLARRIEALSRALEVKLQSHMWQLKNNGLPKWIGITREEASFLIWGYHRCVVCRHS